MVEGEASFRPYLEAEEPEGDFHSGADVERLALDTLQRVVGRLRESLPRRELGTAARLVEYAERHDALRRRELQNDWTSAEYLVAAVLATELGRARSGFLGLAPPWEIEKLFRDRDALSVRRNESFAEAQQFAVTFLLRERDPDVCRNGIRLLAACQTSAWSESPSTLYQALKEGAANPAHTEEAGAYGRGLAAHVAGVRLAQSGAFGPRQRGYAPSPVLDGRHGIDAGFHDAGAALQPIELVAQFKGRERLEAPIVVKVCTGDVSREAVPVMGDVEERSVEERRLADWNRLVRGTARLRDEYPRLVNVPRLIGVYIELRGDEPRTREAPRESSRPALDSATGIYNAAFRDAATAAFEPVQTLIADIRNRRGASQGRRPRRPLLHRRRPVHTP